MADPRPVTRQQLREDPDAAWNEALELFVTRPRPEFNEVQQTAYLVFLYSGDVWNGGHLQYFENKGVENIAAVLAAVRRIGATEHAKNLEDAAALYASKLRAEIRNVEEYSEVALEGEFASHDRRFAQSKPTIDDFLRRYVNENHTQFITLVD